MELEIRISSWDIEKIMQLFKKEDIVILAKEKGAQNNNEHVHIYVHTKTKVETFRNNLKKNWKGLYKLSTVKDKNKYLKYISKDSSEENPWICQNTDESFQEWKTKWLDDGEKILLKGRNKLTSQIIESMLLLPNDEHLKSNIVNLCIKFNGIFPHKTYFNQLLRTYKWKNTWNDDEKRYVTLFLEENII